MKFTVSVFLFFLLAIPASLFGQLSKANRYYDDAQYSLAIPLYKKVIRKADSTEAMQKLANCYRILKQYTDAELYYERVLKWNNVDPIYYFYYGLVLKNNGKLDEAKKQFLRYSILAPNDKSADISVKSCDDIKLWITRATKFEVENVKTVNTKRADFCPVIYKKQLLFVTERTQDIVNFELSGTNSAPFLDVYSVFASPDEKGKMKYAKPKIFSASINTPSHDGPLCFSPDFTKLFITRVENFAEGKNFVNHPKIFIYEIEKSNKVDRDWLNMKSFPYNSDEYSVEHPAMSPDGEYLFFASDMPGGYGGTDIYYSQFSVGKWLKPVNLGPEVNSVGNEVFPCVRKDGVVFFSSDGHSGYGGLDIFSVVKTEGKWGKLTHYDQPLNSPTDDFGIFFSSDDFQKGYFSSDNRKNGIGSDDIYSFITVNKSMNVAGKVLLSQNANDPARNTRIMLLAEDGTVVNFTTSDSAGFFQFENLSPDMKFFVKLDENDPGFKQQRKYYLADTNDKIIRATVYNEKGGKFTFMNLPADINSLPLLEELEIAFSMVGKIAYGDSASLSLGNARVFLLNEKGEIIKTIVTNAAGEFAFTQLSPDEKYFIKVDEEDIRLKGVNKLFVKNSKGDVVSTIDAKDRQFKYALLPADQTNLQTTDVEDVWLKLSMTGKLLAGSGSNKALESVRIELINAEGKVIQTVTTNERGEFNFTHLPPDQNFLVRIKEEDAKLLKMNKVLLTDAKGNLVNEMVSDRLMGFTYEVLSADKNSITLMSVDDSELKFSLKGGILNGDGSNAPMDGIKIVLVNNKGDVLQKTLSDKMGHFLFRRLPPDNNYRLTIDVKDNKIKGVTKLFLTDESGKKVKEIRVSTKGEFTFEMLAADNVNFGLLVEEDSNLNTKMLGKIVSADPTKGVVAGAKVNLVNDAGEIIATGYTNERGEFVFENLPADQSYFVRLDELDASMLSDIKMQIMNDKGETIKEVYSNKGDFNYGYLAGEENVLQLIDLDESTLRLNLKGKLLGENALPITDSKVTLLDGRGHTVQTAQTDKSGKFLFSNLPPNEDYSVMLDTTDPQLKKAPKLIVADEQGVTVREIRQSGNNNFTFRLLPADIKVLGTLYKEDEFAEMKSLRKKIGADISTGTVTQGAPVFSPIYFEFNKSMINEEVQRQLAEIVTYITTNKDMKLEIIGHTDSKGSDIYNQVLSYKRARQIADYFIKTGVPSKKLVTNGMGEKRPLKPNENPDGTDNIDGRAKNRRVEFKVMRKK